MNRKFSKSARDIFALPPLLCDSLLLFSPLSLILNLQLLQSSSVLLFRLSLVFQPFLFCCLLQGLFFQVSCNFFTFPFLFLSGASATRPEINSRYHSSPKGAIKLQKNCLPSFEQASSSFLLFSSSAFRRSSANFASTASLRASSFRSQIFTQRNPPVQKEAI